MPPVDLPTGAPPTPAVDPPAVIAPCPECDIEIVDETGTVVIGLQNRVVGQLIQLWVRARPTGHQLMNIQWTIEGQTVGTYTQSNSVATATPLTTANRQVDHVSFYWINGDFGGAREAVSVTATVAGAAKSTTASFNVFRPRMDNFKTTVSSVNVCVDNYLEDTTGTFLAAYSPPNTPGILWSALVTAPAGGTGHIAFTQLISINRTKIPNTGSAQTLSSGGDLVFDQDRNGRSLDGIYSLLKLVPAYGTETLDHCNNEDSPAEQLDASLRTVAVGDFFNVYLRYRPSGNGSIWVTLGVAFWSWTGTVTRIGAPDSKDNIWNAPFGATLPHSNGSDSIALPTWTRSVTSIKYV